MNYFGFRVDEKKFRRFGSGLGFAAHRTFSFPEIDYENRYLVHENGLKKAFFLFIFKMRFNYLRGGRKKKGILMYILQHSSQK